MSMTVFPRTETNRRARLAAALAAAFFLLSASAGAQTAAARPGSAQTAAGTVAARETLVYLPDAAAKLGASLFWDPLSGTATLSKNGHLANFRSDDPLVLFDYREFAFLDPPVRSSRGVFLTAAFVGRLESFFDTLPPPVLYRVGAIIIDPGHGGIDPGTSGKAVVGGKTVNLTEKEIALKVAREVHARLLRQYPDKKILLTRTGDTFPSLEDRVEMANSVQLGEHEAILYISIHANAAFNRTSKGFEVWYLPSDYRRTVIDKTDGAAEEILPILNSMMEEEFTTESILIAKSIMEELVGSIGKQSPNRGLKEEAWFVVRNACMPSVLVELGFLSNPAEAALLADDAYLSKCATGIYNGLASFITHFEGSRGFTSVQ